MAGFNDDSNFHQRDDDFNLRDFKQFPENRKDAVFDASQYAFFGHDVVEEVELGGLEDDDIPHRVLDDDGFNIHHTILDDNDFLSTDGQQFDDFDSRPRNMGSTVDDSVSENDWRDRTSSSSRFDQILQEEEDTNSAKRWSSNLPFHSLHNPGKLPLHRTSSLCHPHQTQPTNFPPTELTQTSNHRYLSPDLLHRHIFHHDHPNLTYNPDRDISRLLSSSPSSNFTLSSSVSPPFPHGFSPARRPPTQWLNHSNGLPNLFRSQLPFPNRGPHLHHLRLHPPPPHPQNMPFGLNRPPFAPHNPIFFTSENSSDVFSSTNFRDNCHFSRPARDFYLMRRPQLRSKYMTGDELENILRIQHAAVHTDDPYMDDYYNQARLSAKSQISNPKHHFCPKTMADSLLEDPRPAAEPHPFLQVEALGRMPFSSFRRPRPLIELDPPPPPFSGKIELQKLLEVDPILAAKAAIEHCNFIILDIDDIDRFLRFNHPWDGGIDLARRRNSLLEILAANLRIVDPLKAVFSPKDDTLFLLIASLPKGITLLSRYLQLVFPSGDLLRLLCMTFFRNLKFFSEISSSGGVNSLMAAVSSSVSRMELEPLSACLVAVVCSPELPKISLASSLLKSVLERATELLTDPRNGMRTRDLPNRTLWEASFDKFFTLLTNYCFHTYNRFAGSLFAEEGIDHETNILLIEAQQAIGREIPVELLRASLPHTNEQQRAILLDLARLSMPVAVGAVDT